MTYLTAPITAKTVDDSQNQIIKAKELGADMVELRFDYIEAVTDDVVKTLVDFAKQNNIKTIATCRRTQEGGIIDYPRQVRVKILEAAAQYGADFIDCEFETYKKATVAKNISNCLKQTKTQLILSVHNFKKPIKNLQEIYDAIILTCPQAIPKIAYKANHINDCFDAFDLLKNNDGDLIVIAMGADGVITRIFTKKFGGMVCFASIDDQNSTAPGQITISQMKKLFRYDRQDKDTELFGVIGSPIAHSMSPALHNGLFAKMDMNKVYAPLLVKGDRLEFSEFMDNIVKREWLGFRGLSVTLPHKINALDYISKAGGFINDQATKIDAVNTITIGYNERLNAYNTDYEGAMDALINGMGITKKQLEHKTAAVIGAGGVSRAVVAGLTDAGVRVVIYNRTISKAKRLANDFNCHYLPIDNVSEMVVDILVNCTSVGMLPDIDSIPVPESVIGENMSVFDTVYNPIETKLLNIAKQKGAKTINGLEMFINQAIEQFKHFTGKTADSDVVRDIITRNNREF